jgi:predicted negative regulator of RcsB-dependent stress response
MKEVKQKVEKQIEVVQKFKNNNMRLLVVAAIIILAFLLYGTFNNSYHKKEIKALENEIGVVQKKFEAAVEEKAAKEAAQAESLAGREQAQTITVHVGSASLSSVIPATEGRQVKGGLKLTQKADIKKDKKRRSCC